MGHLYLKKDGAWAEQNAILLYRKVSGQWVKGNWSDLDVKKYVFKHIIPKTKIHYVSLGDSIAAGHAINAEWATNYGEGSQYGKNGRTETVIVPGSYTDLIRRELVGIYGEDRVSVKSFARSGERVDDLIYKLSHAAVRSAIEQADIVTFCIGANDVLEPALMDIDQYISTGDLSGIAAQVEANMAVLNNDAAPTSFVSLFNRLVEINPKAKYVFTTIYNPYKYLWIEEGRSGFFGPLVNYIDWVVDVPYINYQINMGAYIQERILQTSAFQLVFSRVNGVGEWAEQRVNRLNEILRNKINAYQATSPNFFVAETKVVFDLFPDKTDSTVDVDYSDLVNVEFTRTYNTAKMDWGALWRGSNAATFWSELGAKHLYWINAFPSTNPMDYVDFHMEEYAADLVQQVIDKVIIPNVDPHPEPHGHQVLKRSFTNVWGLTKYEPNGGESVPGDVVLAQRAAILTDAIRNGYRFDGWFADAQLQNEVDLGSLTDYSANHTLADLVDGSSVRAKTPKTTTLYAKWYANE